MTASHPPTASDQPHYNLMSGCLARAVWMLAGNLALAFCLLKIVQGRQKAMSSTDAVFWGIAAAQLLLWWLDMYWLDGQKILGPLRPGRQLRFPAIFLAVCLAAWLAVHLSVYLIASP